MERENSKTTKVQQTVITNRIQWALMLAQLTINGIDTKLYRKACVTDIDKKTFKSFDVLNVFKSSPFIFFTKSEVSVIKRRKDILSEIKYNQKVAGRLTFDLLTSRRAEHILLWRMSLYIFDILFYHLTSFCNNFYGLSASAGCWSSDFIRRIIYIFFNVCPFDNTAFAVSGRIKIL